MNSFSFFRKKNGILLESGGVFKIQNFPSEWNFVKIKTRRNETGRTLIYISSPLEKEKNISFFILVFLTNLFEINFSFNEINYNNSIQPTFK